jgi:GNAT superfamily N-acetyltransferase
MPRRGAAKALRRSEPAPFAPKAVDVTITEVKTAAERDAFVRFQPEHYANDPHYVPQIIAERRDFIDPERNSFFTHARAAFFLAHRAGKVAGRIVAMNDTRYNSFHEVSWGTFGLFECQNDPGVASCLFQAAATWLKSEGLSPMVGPLNLSFHHDVGLLVEGFDKPPGMNLTYNPRYYARLFETNGFTKHKDLFCYEIGGEALPDKVTRFAQRVRERGQITVRRIDGERSDDEGRRVKEIYEATIKRGWGFFPLTDKEFEEGVNRLRPLLMMRPEMCFIAEAAGTGEPVAYCITMPDMNQALRAAGGHLSRFGLPIGLLKMAWAARKIDRVRVLMFGIKPGFRRRGIDALLADETFKEARRLGYTTGELGLVVEDEALMIRTIAATGARRTKVYRIYERQL